MALAAVAKMKTLLGQTATLFFPSVSLVYRLMMPSLSPSLCQRQMRIEDSRMGRAPLPLSLSSVQRTRYGSYPLSSSRLVPSSVARPGKSDLRHTYTLMGWPCSLLSLMDFQFQVRRWPLSGHVHASRSGVRTVEFKPYPVPNSANRPIPCFRKKNP